MDTIASKKTKVPCEGGSSPSCASVARRRRRRLKNHGCGGLWSMPVVVAAAALVALVHRLPSSVLAFAPTATIRSSTRRPLSSSVQKQLQQRQNLGSSPFRLAATFSSPPPSPPTKNDGRRLTEAQFDQYLQQAELGSAVRLLQQQQQQQTTAAAETTIELNAPRLSRIFDAIEECTMRAEENTENLRRLAETATASSSFPVQSQARQDMTDMYDALQSANALRLYGAARAVPAPAAGSHTVSPAVLEQILDLPLRALTPSSQSTGSVWIAGAVVALAEGLLSLGTGIDVNTLFWTSLALAFLDRLFLNGAVVESIVKVFTPTMHQKILRHEAGHFLTAYLLGCPVEGIVLSAWDALQDSRFGHRQVSAGTSFYDPQLSQQINQVPQTQAAQAQAPQITRGSIDRYSIIVMSGIAAEADSYGRADGGAGDEMALVAFLSKLNGNANARTRTTVWDSDGIRNQARWGALQAVLLLREYKPAYNALVDALERGGRLGDCIQAIESAAVQHGLQPLQQPVGYLVDDESSVDYNGRATTASWTRTPPTPQSSSAATTTTTVESSSSAAASAAAAATTTTTSSATPASLLTEEESLAVLKEYRTATEKRLQELDERLKEIQTQNDTPS